MFEGQILLGTIRCSNRKKTFNIWIWCSGNSEKKCFPFLSATSSLVSVEFFCMFCLVSPGLVLKHYSNLQVCSSKIYCLQLSINHYEISVWKIIAVLLLLLSLMEGRSKIWGCCFLFIMGFWSPKFACLAHQWRWFEVLAIMGVGFLAQAGCS